MNFMGLSLAANTMFNNRKALEIIGQNIANAETPGYSRQEATMSLHTFGYSLEPPSSGTLHLGSKITEITRFRSEILDKSFRRETHYYGELNSKSQLLNEVAQIFNDDTSLGLVTHLNKFWQSWNEASAKPEDSALRSMVINQGEFLACSIRTKDHQLNELSARIGLDIRRDVEEMNSLIQQLAVINDEIAKSVPQTFPSNILLDKKDFIIDKLSEYANIQVNTSVKNSLSIYLDGSPVLVDKTAYSLTVVANEDGSMKIVSALGRDVNVASGSIKGMMDIKNDYISRYRNELNEWTVAFMAEINDIHKVGYGLDGTTGKDFFKGTGVSNLQVAINNSDHLALSVPTLTSGSNLNMSGTILDISESLADEFAKFKIPPDSSGSFSINGTVINWDDTQSLEEILNELKDATGINWIFDSNAQKITLSSPPDSSVIVIEDVTGNFTEFTNLAEAVLEEGSTGDGENGIRIFELSQRKIFGSPEPIASFNERYQSIVAGIGYDTNVNTSSMETQRIYADSLSQKRDAISGVSIDEEVINLIKYQRTFQAGAKLASIIDEILEHLINRL